MEHQGQVGMAAEGWEASCSCGWAGNNPHPSEEDATASINDHYASVGMDDVGGDYNRLEGLGVSSV